MAKAENGNGHRTMSALGPRRGISKKPLWIRLFPFGSLRSRRNQLQMNCHLAINEFHPQRNSWPIPSLTEGQILSAHWTSWTIPCSSGRR